MNRPYQNPKNKRAIRELYFAFPFGEGGLRSKTDEVAITNVFKHYYDESKALLNLIHHSVVPLSRLRARAPRGLTIPQSLRASSLYTREPNPRFRYAILVCGLGHLGV